MNRSRLFDLTGRPMQGWLLVGKPGTRDDEALGRWVRRGLEYAASLPEKEAK